MFKVEIVKDSVYEYGTRLTTFVLAYPRFIHSEVMTHRVLSRNAMSSRAVPVAKMLEQVRNEPAMPIHWGQNQAGMQAVGEVDRASAEKLWREAAVSAAAIAERMAAIGLHKQVANRILEPFQVMRTLVTATEWENFYELRAHPDAQPEFQRLANMMQAAQLMSRPQHLEPGQWHLPFITLEELAGFDEETLCKISAARCARVSYLTHDGATPDVGKDLQLFDRLAGSQPLHASPLEHQATPGNEDTGNFVGWTQFRKLWEKDL